MQDDAPLSAEIIGAVEGADVLRQHVQDDAPHSAEDIEKVDVSYVLQQHVQDDAPLTDVIIEKVEISEAYQQHVQVAQETKRRGYALHKRLCTLEDKNNEGEKPEKRKKLGGQLRYDRPVFSTR